MYAYARSRSYVFICKPSPRPSFAKAFLPLSSIPPPLPPSKCVYGPVWMGRWETEKMCSFDGAQEMEHSPSESGITAAKVPLRLCTAIFSAHSQDSPTRRRPARPRGREAAHASWHVPHGDRPKVRNGRNSARPTCTSKAREREREGRGRRVASIESAM